MATSSLIPVKPIGNGAGSNLPGPSSISSGSNLVAGTNGVAGSLPVSMVPTQNPPVLPPGTTGAPTSTLMPSSPLLPTNGVTPTASPTSTVPTAAGTPNLLAGANDANVNKQLTDEYGKGVGGVIGSELENLGSADSSYMTAYENAMAMPNSEQLSTLQTSLGNEGISGNSSTAALATADLLSQETSQEGLQEQQLLQSNIAEQVGLTESLEGTANKDVSQSGWSIFGEVAGDVAGAAATALI